MKKDLTESRELTILCLIWVLATYIFLTGCGPSQTQLQAEQSYYQMLSARQSQAQPLVDIKIADPTKPANIERILVYSPSSNDKLPPQYQQHDYAAKWVGLIGSAVQVAAPWAGAWAIVSEIGRMNVGGTSYNQTINGEGNTASMKASSIATGNMGDGNSLSGMTDINNSYNPTTTNTTTTTTDDHTTAVP